VPVPGYLIGHGGGQHRRIAGHPHLDVRQSLRPPPQVPAGIADDVILIPEDIAAKGGPLQAGMHEYPQRGLVAGRECGGTKQGRFGHLLFRSSATERKPHRDTSVVRRHPGIAGSPMLSQTTAIAQMN
jgi:hypothetical protein